MSNFNNKISKQKYSYSVTNGKTPNWQDLSNYQLKANKFPKC